MLPPSISSLSLFSKICALNLSLQQAAARLGKSLRQVRYMIQQGTLPARKVQGRWVVNGDDLPGSAGQKVAHARKARQMRGLVEDALEVPAELPRRYSVLDLKGFQICLPLYRRAAEVLGEGHPATLELKRTLTLLAQGCHRYERADKAAAYRDARDAASLAVCELVLADSGATEDLRGEIEQDLMASLAGLIRRAERQGRRGH
jgi:Helix-turn-helix domain